jgi:hypothetical protein
VLSFGGNPSGGGQTADAKYIFAQIWSRGLSAMDVLQLYLDPFCVLLPSTAELDLPGIVLPQEYLETANRPIFRVRMPGWGDI